MRNNKGVTLVELLVVIVVMGIIAGFSIPAVGNIITNANKDAVLNDAIQIENAARLYCSSTTDVAFCETGGVGNGIDPVNNADLGGYIEGLSGYTYAWVYKDGDDWNVFIQNTEYVIGVQQTAQPDGTTTDDIGVIASDVGRAGVQDFS